jgi:hypothetical protein
MYEPPTLVSVGSAENVILGLANPGFDLDSLYVIGTHEFENDFDAPTNQD